MKKLNGDTEHKQIIDSNKSYIVDVEYVFEKSKSLADSEMINLKDVVTALFNIFHVDESADMYIYECSAAPIYNRLPNDIEICKFSDKMFFDVRNMEIIFNNFEDKYLIPFLLHSLGYKHEEIASVLMLPTNIVKSRVFYVQKKMQALLIDMRNGKSE